MLYLWLCLYAAAVAALDLGSKYLASVYLAGKTVVLIPGWLQLHYITNDGMALSLFRGGRWAFVALTAVFFAVVIWAVVTKQFKKQPELWLLAGIVGGAVGNLYDRIATGQVIDMICVPWFSTFNVADIFITVGAVLLVLYICIWDKEFFEEKPKEKDDGADA